MSDTKDVAAALLDVAHQSIERDDAHSLAFALRRAGALGVINEGLALGTSIQHLTSVPASIAERAISLLRQEAVASSEPKVAYALGRIYALGILGMKQNDELAFKYFARAADLGMPVAQIFAGLYAMQGVGCVASSEVAMNYFEQAAAAGFLVASRNIVLLRQDIGSLRKSLELFKLSVQAFRLALADASSSRLFLLNPVATPGFELPEKPY